MSEPTDKELFKTDLHFAILAIIMCPICLFLSRFSLVFFPEVGIIFYVMGIIIFPLLAIFRFIVYITKPNYFRKKKYKNWESRRLKKLMKKG